MANRRIDELTALAEKPATDDYVPVWDESASTTKKMLPKFLAGALGPAENVDISSGSITVTGYHAVVSNSMSEASLTSISSANEGDLLALQTASGVNAFSISNGGNILVRQQGSISVYGDYIVLLVYHGGQWRHVAEVDLNGV
jgi:hypothetical protein